ncbi:hypothetical protein KR009_008550, partial [Drosophila setifemur]
NFQLWILAFGQMWSWLAESAAISEPPPPRVPILKSQAEQQIDGSYFFSFEGADGSYREEVGIVRKSDSELEDDELEVSGAYRYTDDSGQKVEVSYTGDKNSFWPHVKYVA